MLAASAVALACLSLHNTAVSAEEGPLSRRVSARMWAAGDERGVFLVLAQRRDGRDGFEVLHRAKVAKAFRAGPWYTGRPASVVSFDDRCCVFLVSGGCHSYDLYSSARTEPRSPRRTHVLASTATKHRLYILVQADEPIELAGLSEPDGAGESHRATGVDDLPGVTPPAEANDGPVTSVLPASPGTVFVDTGGCVVLSRDKAGAWYCHQPGPLPVGGWRQPDIAVLGDEVLIFGLSGDEAGEPRNSSSLVYCRAGDGAVGAIETFPRGDVQAFTALTVNRQLCLVILVNPAESAQGGGRIQAAPAVAGRYYLAKLRAGGEWDFSEPLKADEGEFLAAEPSEVCFATFDQGIAAFLWQSGREVLFGHYDLTGALTRSITEHVATGAQGSQLWHMLLDGRPFVMVAVMVIVFWRRRDAFLEPGPLKDYIQLAPLWRRLLAFLLDIIPVSIVSTLLAAKLFPQQLDMLVKGQDLFEMTQFAAYDPAFSKYLAALLIMMPVLLICYASIWELLMAATPGKAALKLTVLSANGDTPTARAVILRNLLRFLELYPDIPLMILILVVFTRRRQRVGDLVAGTIVVMNSEDLQRRLHQPEADRRDGDGQDGPPAESRKNNSTP